MSPVFVNFQTRTGECQIKEKELNEDYVFFWFCFLEKSDNSPDYWSPLCPVNFTTTSNLNPYDTSGPINNYFTQKDRTTYLNLFTLPLSFSEHSESRSPLCLNKHFSATMWRDDQHSYLIYSTTRGPTK